MRSQHNARRREEIEHWPQLTIDVYVRIEVDENIQIEPTNEILHKCGLYVCIKFEDVVLHCEIPKIFKGKFNQGNRREWLVHKLRLIQCIGHDQHIKFVIGMMCSIGPREYP